MNYKEFRNLLHKTKLKVESEGKIGEGIKIIDGNISFIAHNLSVRDGDSPSDKLGFSYSHGIYAESDYSRWSKIELLNNYISMDIKESFVLAFLKEPEKSFRKAGVTDGDGFLTEDGIKVFLGYLLSKNGEDFKKEVVDSLLEEREKEEKK